MIAIGVEVEETEDLQFLRASKDVTVMSQTR